MAEDMFFRRKKNTTVGRKEIDRHLTAWSASQGVEKKKVNELVTGPGKEEKEKRTE